MQKTILIIMALVVSSLTLLAQKKSKGQTINLTGETIEVNIPLKTRESEMVEQSKVIKQVESSIQNELMDYTREMQDQRFISNNVITEVSMAIDTSTTDPSLKVTYSYRLLNDTLRFQTDDFGLGKYRVNESNALQVTLAVMKRNVEGQLAKYLTTDKDITVTVSGSADASPILKPIAYRGEFGDQLYEGCDWEGKSYIMEVTTSRGISNNPTLAFLRSYAVRDYLQNNIFQTKYPKLKFFHSASVSSGRGGQFRRVTIEVIIHNALN